MTAETFENDVAPYRRGCRFSVPSTRRRKSPYWPNTGGPHRLMLLLDSAWTSDGTILEGPSMSSRLHAQIRMICWDYATTENMLGRCELLSRVAPRLGLSFKLDGRVLCRVARIFTKRSSAKHPSLLLLHVFPMDDRDHHSTSHCADHDIPSVGGLPTRALLLALDRLPERGRWDLLRKTRHCRWNPASFCCGAWPCRACCSSPVLDDGGRRRTRIPIRFVECNGDTLASPHHT